MTGALLEDRQRLLVKLNRTLTQNTSVDWKARGWILYQVGAWC